MTPQHFLGIEGASVVQTQSLRLVSRAVNDVIRRRAMGAVYGVAGLGKTFATDVATTHAAIPVHYVRPLKRSTMKMVGDALLLEITGIEHKENLQRLTRSAIQVLSEKLRLIVIDEAQRLNEECLEYVRHLHDDPATEFGLLLVGGNKCWEVISKHPMVESRCVRRVEFQPLTREQVLTLIPKYHAIYAEADRELLLLIDDCFAHGNFRNWASFTAAAVDLVAEFALPGLNEEVVRNVFGLYGGDSRVVASGTP